jgi:signal transduction histidine kinase
MAWVISWESSNRPLPFDLAVLVEAPAFWLTFYLFLAFPMGRLQPAAARWLMGALTLAVAAFFLPWALFSPVIAGGGPLTRCAPNCPENVLQLGSAPRLVEVAGKAETYSVLAITVAVLVVYLLRLRAASMPQRRALIAVAVTSLLFLPAYFRLQLQRVDPPPRSADARRAGVGHRRGTRPAPARVPHRVAAGGAVRRPGAAEPARAAGVTTHTLSVARDDRNRARRQRAAAELLRPGHRELPGVRRHAARPPAGGAGLAWVPADRDARPVAAMVIDETLAEDPELVRAAASATLLAVENGDLEGELRASRERILEAGTAERRRIERDLHDSAQQRLVALRINLALAAEQLDPAEATGMLERLGDDVDEAIAKLRAVAHGVYPQILTDLGIGAALAVVARQSPIRVRIQGEWLTRHSEAVETTVYFCCQECLQNAAKHAGAGASVAIHLGEVDGCVSFSVEDDGADFDPAAVEHGAGLTNLADRVAAVGGPSRSMLALAAERASPAR